MKVLLDTNAYSHMRRNHAQVTSIVRGATEIVFSTVVVGELMYGFRKGTRCDENAALLRQFIAEPRVRLLPVTLETAARYGRIAAALDAAGTPVPANDAWIAAHTAESGAELLSFDAHFDRVPGLHWRHLA